MGRFGVIILMDIQHGLLMFILITGILLWTCTYGLQSLDFLFVLVINYNIKKEKEKKKEIRKIRYTVIGVMIRYEYKTKELNLKNNILK